MLLIKCTVGYIEEMASCPRMGGFGIFIKCIIGYSDLEVASCHRIGGFTVPYKVYCRI